MKHVFLIAALLIIAAAGYAITVNPASAVTADSAATALTIPYRDASGNFAVNSITFSGPLSLTSKTIAQLLATAPAVGDTYYCSNCSPAKIAVATGTSAGNFADAAGAAFK